MKLSTFILLNEEQKQSVLLHEGMLLAKRTDPDFMIFLFQLDHYYVEVYGNRVNKKVMEYKAFTQTDQLKPYLETIDIKNLL
jgi:hypothetical protein